MKIRTIIYLKTNNIINTCYCALLQKMIILLIIASITCQSVQDLTGVEVEEVAVVEGFNATLPCRVHPPENDAPLLTLWYIKHQETPIYSYDERPGARGSRWSDAMIFGTRAYYYPHHTPPNLEIAFIKKVDARVYRCRVDYQHSNSRVAWVQLKVIVPPSKIEIVHIKNPVVLGEKHDVICKAYGGTPSPKVIWLQGGTVVDSNFSENGREVYNSLENPTSRQDLQQPFVCRASNNELKRPQDVTYTRNVTCSPLSVEISTEDEVLRENSQAKLTCSVVGSNPAPVVTWYEQGEEVRPLHTRVKERHNITISVLTLNISRNDHGRQIVCRAVNNLLPSSTLEDIYTLSVSYKPRVSINLGRSLHLSNLKEGFDIFFECKVDANPVPYKVIWIRNDSTIDHDLSKGILVSDSSLALQKAQKTASGMYRCKASNVEGDTTSDAINVIIKFSPVCSQNAVVVGVALKETVELECNVSANPSNASFSWSFNNSVRRDQNEPINPKRFTSSGLHSRLKYTPLTEADYGTLLCYATNDVGIQKEPCVFSVISAGPPERVNKCLIENVTLQSCNVVCVPGFNGGIPQRFLLQVWTESGEQVVNFSASVPVFIVRSLSPGHRYKTSVTAFNKRGAAPPIYMYIKTHKEPEMHKSLPSRAAPSPLTLILGVIGGALLVIICLLFGIWIVRGRRRQANAQNKKESSQSDNLKGSSDPDLLAVRAELPSDERQRTDSTWHDCRSTSSFSVSERLQNHPIIGLQGFQGSNSYLGNEDELSESSDRTPSLIGLGGLNLTLGGAGSAFRRISEDSMTRKKASYTRKPLIDRLDVRNSPCVRQPLISDTRETVM